MVIKMKMNQLIKFNQKKYNNDMNIIWDELFLSQYENEIDGFDANQIYNECDDLIDDMECEYFDY